ncbi:hypothetical protein NKH77_40410 [Streptomyces sp. M19]
MPRRRLMVTADLLNAVCLGSVPLAGAFDALTAAHIIVAAFLSSTLYIFFDAAGYGLVPALVGRERLSEANSALWGRRRRCGSRARPRPGLIALMSTSGVLTVDAVSFLASALLIRAIVLPPSDRGDAPAPGSGSPSGRGCASCGATRCCGR